MKTPMIVFFALICIILQRIKLLKIQLLLPIQLKTPLSALKMDYRENYLRVGLNSIPDKAVPIGKYWMTREIKYWANCTATIPTAILM